jgi:hypothetical protein
MAIRERVGAGERDQDQRSLARLRATPEERARILASTVPFDAEVWQRGAVLPTPEELDDLEDFLREHEEARQYSAERQEERMADPGG